MVRAYTDPVIVVRERGVGSRSTCSALSFSKWTSSHYDSAHTSPLTRKAHTCPQSLMVRLMFFAAATCQLAFTLHRHYETAKQLSLRSRCQILNPYP